MSDLSNLSDLNRKSLIHEDPSPVCKVAYLCWVIDIGQKHLLGFVRFCRQHVDFSEY